MVVVYSLGFKHKQMQKKLKESTTQCLNIQIIMIFSDGKSLDLCVYQQ